MTDSGYLGQRNMEVPVRRKKGKIPQRSFTDVVNIRKANDIQRVFQKRMLGIE